MSVPEIEKKIGIGVYSTSTPGIGGTIKEYPEDFQVEEMLKDGSMATIHPTAPQKVSGKGKFMTCILVKNGWDTLLLMREIANGLGIHQRRLSVCGIKDTRALTSQFISIKKVPPSHLLRLKIPRIEIYPQSFARDPMKPDLLLGNQFRIRIRGIEGTPADVLGTASSTLREVEAHGGLPNFFGHQRFGTVRPVSHLVGKSIVKGDFKAAVMTFLTLYSDSESPQAREARRNLCEGGDLQRALQEFPRGLTYERIMTEHLIEKEGDFIGALRSLSAKFLRLLVQAYQSYLFNLALTRRIEGGHPLNQALPGDFVAELDSQGLRSGEVQKADETNLPELNKGILGGTRDLVLPTIGYNTASSDGKGAEFERSLLEAEGVEPKDFYLKEMVDVSSPGGYRSALVKPRDVQPPHVEPEESLGRSSLILAFRLTKGSYATLLLREIMKSSDPISANF